MTSIPRAAEMEMIAAENDALTLTENPLWEAQMRSGYPLCCAYYDDAEGLRLPDNIIAKCSGCGTPVQLRPISQCAVNKFCELCARLFASRQAEA